MTTSITHGQFTIERTMQTSPARLFKAYEDVKQRAEWGSPPGDVMLYDKSDFTIGGSDVYRCGPKQDPKYLVQVQYQEIVPGERIVYVERVSTGGSVWFAALVSLEFASTNDGTRLLLTDQMASFVGKSMIDGARQGSEDSINNLASLVS